MTHRTQHIPSQSPIPILHLIAELSIGGAQSALLRLISHLDRQRYDPRVACFYNGEGAIAKQLLAQGVPVIDLDMSNKFRIDAFWRLFHLLREQRPVILHTWMFHANITGRLLGRLARVPIIISSERTMGQEGRMRRSLNRRTAKLTDSIVCVSHSVADFAIGTIGLPEQKVVVVHNGIELDHYEHLPLKSEARVKFGLPENSVIIGAIGRPRAVKGYPILIDAFSRLAPSHPAAYLVFVGNGPDRARLEDHAHALGLENRIFFINDQIDIPGLLPALDVLALPSLYEGMPNVVIEAMAAALPVVATDVGGTPEVVVDGETGLLVPPSDPDALANGLACLIDDPRLRQCMGEAGRQRAFSQFDILNTVQEFQSLYESLIQP